MAFGGQLLASRQQASQRRGLTVRGFLFFELPSCEAGATLPPANAPLQSAFGDPCEQTLIKVAQDI